MKKVLLAAMVLAAIPAALATSSPAVGEKDRSRHDARCAWGRLADGKGNLVRCITKNEAAWLRVKMPTPAASPKPARSADNKPKAPPDKAPPEGKPAEEAPSKEEKKIEITVGPLEVDQGKLPRGLAKLKKPKARYLKCVTDHGGMFRDQGEVHVRFLVRARGRAEGVHVVKRRSVTKAAGKCIADVVDRRAVGTPSVQMVGATLVVKFSRVDG